MAHSGAGIHIVIAKGGPHQLLDHIGLFIGATARGQPAHRAATIFRLNALKFVGGIFNRLIPRDFLPGICDLLTNHRLGDTVFVGRIAKSKSALDAGMPMIGMTILVGDHANHFGSLHFCFERAANTTVGTGRHDTMFWLALFDHRLFHQGSRRASLNTSTTGHTFRVHERFVLTR